WAASAGSRGWAARLGSLYNEPNGVAPDDLRPHLSTALDLTGAEPGLGRGPAPLPRAGPTRREPRRGQLGGGSGLAGRGATRRAHRRDPVLGPRPLGPGAHR